MLKHCKSIALNYWRLSKEFVVLGEHLHFDFKPSDFPWWMRGLFKEVIKEEGDKVMNEKFFITLPKGFVTDLASIPKYLRWLFKPDGQWSKAAAVHDFLYNGIPITEGHSEFYAEMRPRYAYMEQKLRIRSSCDAIFYIAMRASGVSAAVALAFYLGVRAGGSQHFRTGKRIDVAKLLVGLYPKAEYDFARTADPYPIFTAGALHYNFEEYDTGDEFIFLTLPNLPTPLIVAP